MNTREGCSCQGTENAYRDGLDGIGRKNKESEEKHSLYAAGCTILEIMSPTMGYPQFQRTVFRFLP
jgi:hypothetical protein